eukprot:CAMPEP_0203902938 /NCGR_PEP_ID=MMETSP0359-20131031/44933_1 /ASSEMBLY_ACC=CAM_ASM_000338 /TAXON_ID=268821 /ORGANISM="Scrippsiella Hangoei, Strain SHTV-5" /LENGTH=87 /DNA_ID=CAMNT_0050826885 /DNA_START=46 /DNA_END=309 /DNA_ORIENTATION=-
MLPLTILTWNTLAPVYFWQGRWRRELLELYESQLARGGGFRCESLQRTGLNCDGRSEDGVAIFSRERALEVLDRHDVKFHDYGIPQA